MTTLKKKDKLLNKRDFSNLRDGEILFKNKCLIVKQKLNNLERSRVGLSVSRKVGPAVQRNKIKRIIRESFRNSKNRLSSFDYLFIAKPMFNKEHINKKEYINTIRDTIYKLYN
mgnify:CR=1 FL=1